MPAQILNLVRELALGKPYTEPNKHSNGTSVLASPSFLRYSSSCKNVTFCCFFIFLFFFKFSLIKQGRIFINVFNVLNRLVPFYKIVKENFSLLL